MIFKVTYQPSKKEAPLREHTHTLYLDAENKVEARHLLEKNTPYNIEFIQALDPKHLEYERKSSDFRLTEF